MKPEYIIPKKRNNTRVLAWKSNHGNTLFIFIAMAVLWLLSACNFPVEDVLNLDDPTTTPDVSVGIDSISGTVWHDLCLNLNEADAPPPGCQFDTARNLYLANGIFETGESGIAGVEVSLGKGVCPSKGLASVLTDNLGGYRFSDLVPGEYCISAKMGTTNVAKTEPGAWTYPVSDSGAGVGWISITLDEFLFEAGVNFGWDYLLKPLQMDGEATPTPTETPVCENRAGFVQDVTIVDGAHLSPNESFNKTWRLKNMGSCVWTMDYTLVFHEGDPMENQNGVRLAQAVEPGQMIDLSVPLVAPGEVGFYEGYWMLRDPEGERFGIGKKGDIAFWVKIQVGSVWSPTSVVSWDYSLNPEELANEGRWIDVDLGDQIVKAYQGSTPVMQFLVSTGTASTPTVTGQFRIWIKLRTDDMSGPGYSLEDVPYTMYFYQGYGLHGTFWHDNFGTPMSHGCVNLKTAEAAWLFDFASEGTLVNVHP
jgi:hypothetical protein